MPNRPEHELHAGSYRDVMTHKMMLEDAVRTSAYRDAIGVAVSPGSRVIDFGSGTGVLAIFAAQREAARVDAIERTAMVHYAREIALANGHPEIVFHEGDQNSFETDGLADIIISEWMGHFVFFESMLGPLLTLRDKWLKPEGKMLPEQITLYAGLVTDANIHEEDVFLDGAPYGIDFSPIAEFPRRASRLADFNTDQLLTPYCKLGTLEMRTIAAVPEVLTGRVQVQTEAVVYGLLGWFDSVLAGTVELGTGPHQAPTHWRQIYFPFPEPLVVSPARPLTINIRPPKQTDVPEPSWAWSISDGISVRSVDERTTFTHCRRFTPTE
jgi:type I protein arginine methyltransferase